MCDETTTVEPEAKPVNLPNPALLLPSLSRSAAAVDLLVLGFASWLAFWIVEPSLTVHFRLLPSTGAEIFAPRAAAGGIVLLAIGALAHVRRLSRASCGVWTRGVGDDAMKGALLVPVLFAIRLACAVVAWACCAASSVPYLPEAAVHRAESLARTPHMGSLLLLLVVGAVLEEALMRGTILPRLRRIFGSWTAAVLLSGAAFALLHLPCSIPTLISLFLGSVVLSVAFVRSGSLVTVMAAHFLVNCVSVFIVAKS